MMMLVRLGPEEASEILAAVEPPAHVQDTRLEMMLASARRLDIRQGASSHMKTHRWR